MTHTANELLEERKAIESILKIWFLKYLYFIEFTDLLICLKV
jgi:hypothetical protein